MEEYKDLLLMMKDCPVMRMNFDLGKYDVLNEHLLPFQLKNRIHEVLRYEDVKSRYDDTQRQIAIGKNRDSIINWLAGRVLPLSRENAKRFTICSDSHNRRMNFLEPESP